MKKMLIVFGAATAMLFPRECVAANAAPDPETVFRNPPQSAKTGVWWHWMGSNVSKEGIVKDLDWFKETGIGAATIFGMADVCSPWATKIENPPTGKLVAFTPEWWALVKFACEEAEKRGIEIGIHNCPGYTSTGGPWIPPRLAMRELVFNVTNAEKQISLKAHAAFPVQNGETGTFEKPEIPSRRADLQEIAVVDGVRVQHIPMGSFTQPNQWEVFGLECDKMNPEAVAFHLDKVLGDMKKYVGEQVGRGLKFVLLDSYEAGKPTWTPRMREEFKARRGYDPLPFLPILGGFKVAAAPDEEAEKKFRKDYDRTIKDLYRDVLFKTMHEKLNAAGLEFACEPYTGPFDSRECAAHVDRIMTEFWFKPMRDRKVPKPLGWNQWTGPGGKRHNVVEAEAFTSGPPSCNWTETPALLKAAADEQFARGVNRMVLHSCPLQPWGDDVKPGKAMGRWGTHFGRNQTWAKSGKGFFDYLNRCQALLQWGEPGRNTVRGLNITPKGTQVSSLCREADGRSLFFVANHSGHAASLDLGLSAKDVSARWFDPVTGRVSPVEVTDGKVSVSFPPHGSGFLETSHEKPMNAAKSVEGTRTLRVPAPLRETFTVTFGDVEVEMPELKDWTTFDDPRIKYFSGTAVYKCKVEDVKCKAGERAILSLGDCNGQIAKVVLNGRDLGTAWCEPYEVEIPHGVLKDGANALRIEFTNVWANRLIGDEQEPPDCDFAKAPYPGGWYLTRFPDWFKDGIASRPSKGRKCFTDWNYFTKDSPLVPSGLLGPVGISFVSKSEAISGRAADGLDLGAMLQPLPDTAVLREDGYFVWGGSMAKGDDRTYHLYYSRWKKEFTFNGWLSHSEIAHATAPSAFGPWTHRDVALPKRGAAFWDGMCTHNPCVRKFGGRYYLYYMGNTGDGKVVKGLNWTHRNNQRIGVAVADSPDGPWKRFDKPLVDASPDKDAPDSLMVSNPAITQRPDGTYVMLYKAVGRKRPLPFGGPVVHLAATATSPEGPFAKNLSPLFTDGKANFPAEDPCLFTLGGKVYAVIKDQNGHFVAKKGRSLVLFEEDGRGGWKPAEHPFVTGTELHRVSGEIERLKYLERPQIYIEDGKPVALLCAAGPLGMKDSFNVQIPLALPPPDAPVGVLKADGSKERNGQ